jgi:hypothetical protein
MEQWRRLGPDDALNASPAKTGRSHSTGAAASALLPRPPAARHVVDERVARQLLPRRPALRRHVPLEDDGKQVVQNRHICAGYCCDPSRQSVIKPRFIWSQCFGMMAISAQ